MEYNLNSKRLNCFRFLSMPFFFALGFQASQHPGTSSTLTFSHPVARLFGAESATEKNEGIHAPAPIVGAGLLCRILAYGLCEVPPKAGKWSEGFGWPHSKSLDATQKWVRQALRPEVMRRPFGQAVRRRIPSGLRGGLDDENRVKRAGASTNPVGR
jgi:hypothetical protein